MYMLSPLILRRYFYSKVHSYFTYEFLILVQWVVLNDLFTFILFVHCDFQLPFCLSDLNVTRENTRAMQCLQMYY